jgi:flagellar hook-length control protein FliK
MSAAAALLTPVNVSAPGATPLPTGEAIDLVVNVESAFQMLVAEFGAGPAPDAELGALTLDSSGAVDADREQKTDQATDSDDQTLIDMMTTLCAWQPPLLPAQGADTAVGADAGNADDAGATATPESGTGAAAITAIVADAPGSGSWLPQAELPVVADADAPAAIANANGTDAMLAAARSSVSRQPQQAAPDPQLAEMVTAVVAETTPVARQKSTTSGVEALLSQVDAATSGTLLRMPVVSSSATRTVAVPVHDARWPEAVATQIRWAVADGVQSATLKLVPEHLGPVELHIELKDNQVNVNFGASQADTRQALQEALPRLREVLAGAGITLGQANVQQQSGRASQSATHNPRLQRDDAAESVATHTRMALGLVDLYA